MKTLHFLSLLFASTAFADVKPGVPVKAGTELRILPLGDSITWGYHSPDGNGYRLQLHNDLSGDKVVFAGVIQSGNMIDNWNGGYPGKTIKYIAGQAPGSLAQNPNIVLLMAGTNDMNPNNAISTEGTDAKGAMQRLSDAVDQIFKTLPDVVILLAKIPNAADNAQEANINAYNALIPNVVSNHAGKHIHLVDMSVLRADQMVDGLHPNEAAYRQMGDIWYQGLHAIPSDWIKPPAGGDPSHSLNTKGTNNQPALTPVDSGEDISSNGGPATDIPAPVFHHNPLPCEIASGIGHAGDAKFNMKWDSAGQIAAGIQRDGAGVQLFDVDGDGKADYLWVDQTTGQLICFKNNYPKPYTTCGNNNGVIASGAGPRDKVFFAYMKGDSKADYLVLNGDTGAVTIYWNEGPDSSAPNGWRYVPGGTIASGVPHANIDTIRFADMNGDGRSDYVFVGQNGALELYLNFGQQGSHDITFYPQNGIATGASKDISRLLLSDINGDGRADYLVLDDQAGMTGYLNIRTRDEGTPLFGSPGPVMNSINQSPDGVRIADIDGDGLNDYCYVDKNGALTVWFNRGSGDASTTGDGVRMADIDGDGIDDYIWIEESTGAPTVYLNKGPNSSSRDGWLFVALNNGNPIASGACRREQVYFADIDGDKRADYLCVDPKTGAVTAYLNGGSDSSAPNNFRFTPVGQIASGLGPGANARFADIDGDGKADYIELRAGGATTIWKNNYPNAWSALPSADAAGVGRPPREITFADINGDGKADYIWTNPLSGQPSVYNNQYPNTPTWLPANPEPNVSGENVSGQSTIYARLVAGGKAQPVFVDTDHGAIAAFVNGCHA